LGKERIMLKTLHGVLSGVRGLYSRNSESFMVWAVVCAFCVFFAGLISVSSLKEREEQQREDAFHEEIAQQRAYAKAQGWAWAFTDDAEILAQRLRAELPKRDGVLTKEKVQEYAVYLAEIGQVHGLPRAKARLAADAVLNLWLAPRGVMGTLIALPQHEDIVWACIAVAQATDPVVPWSVEALTAMLWELNVRKLP